MEGGFHVVHCRGDRGGIGGADEGEGDVEERETWTNGQTDTDVALDVSGWNGGRGAGIPDKAGAKRRKTWPFRTHLSYAGSPGCETACRGSCWSRSLALRVRACCW
ncbi:hypothetical protein BC939DRAFT_278563 [Gamsiella multidivaricata]|uniref:uncharacterized protein n=1 Tax=Gamsiella multidivaricata TaxID=101098 RepID=UPI0022212A7C|nr:uncharacterized protein BC939DRAFT_278563 [Gamsiella multidivaricata]KAI7818812.1 hypothetical protein BC939DRAFT_278563 [Gamsiella multidivaricata]